ncbi:MAG TPA: hypothetical protein VEK35_01845, partial [Roseiarcus sp.]|nr:hypothetical protein [Roseiarcus sp.]
QLKSREELVESLIAELAAPAERRGELMAAIDRDERIIASSRSIANARNFEQLRTYIKKYQKVLRKVRALTDGLGVRDRSVMFGGLPSAVAANSGRFLGEVDRLIDAAETYLTDPLAETATGPWDARKFASALRAQHLVRDFSRKTAMSGALTARVAAILYEIATARPVADISDYLAPESLVA